MKNSDFDPLDANSFYEYYRSIQGSNQATEAQYGGESAQSGSALESPDRRRSDMSAAIQGLHDLQIGYSSRNTAWSGDDGPRIGRSNNIGGSVRFPQRIKREDDGFFSNRFNMDRVDRPQTPSSSDHQMMGQVQEEASVESVQRFHQPGANLQPAQPAVPRRRRSFFSRAARWMGLGREQRASASATAPGPSRAAAPAVAASPDLAQFASELETGLAETPLATTQRRLRPYQPADSWSRVEADAQMIDSFRRGHPMGEYAATTQSEALRHFARWLRMEGYGGGLAEFSELDKDVCDDFIDNFRRALVSDPNFRESMAPDYNFFHNIPSDPNQRYVVTDRCIHAAVEYLRRRVAGDEMPKHFGHTKHRKAPAADEAFIACFRQQHPKGASSNAAKKQFSLLRGFAIWLNQNQNRHHHRGGLAALDQRTAEALMEQYLAAERMSESMVWPAKAALRNLYSETVGIEGDAETIEHFKQAHPMGENSDAAKRQSEALGHFASWLRFQGYTGGLAQLAGLDKQTVKELVENYRAAVAANFGPKALAADRIDAAIEYLRSQLTGSRMPKGFGKTTHRKISDADETFIGRFRRTHPKGERSDAARQQAGMLRGLAVWLDRNHRRGGLAALDQAAAETLMELYCDEDDLSERMRGYGKAALRQLYVGDGARSQAGRQAKRYKAADEDDAFIQDLMRNHPRGAKSSSATYQATGLHALAKWLREVGFSGGLASFARLDQTHSDELIAGFYASGPSNDVARRLPSALDYLHEKVSEEAAEASLPAPPEIPPAPPEIPAAPPETPMTSFWQGMESELGDWLGANPSWVDPSQAAAGWWEQMQPGGYSSIPFSQDAVGPAFQHRYDQYGILQPQRAPDSLIGRGLYDEMHVNILGQDYVVRETGRSIAPTENNPYGKEFMLAPRMRGG